MCNTYLNLLFHSRTAFNTVFNTYHKGMQNNLLQLVMSMAASYWYLLQLSMNYRHRVFYTNMIINLTPIPMHVYKHFHQTLSTAQNLYKFSVFEHDFWGTKKSESNTNHTEIRKM